MKRIPVAAVLVSLALIQPGRGADHTCAGTNLDSAFMPGLAKLKEAGGFTEAAPDRVTTDWQPNLQLLVGVKAVEGDKRTIHFVELTTLRPPPTNSAGQPWQPTLRTNNWGWSPTNKARFITTNFPVRVRVFDEAGRLLKEGQTPMAWGMLTNGLMDLCRLSLETYRNRTNRSFARAQMSPDAARGNNGPDKDIHSVPRRPLDEQLALATGGGFLWMIGMFDDLQTLPSVADVWEEAQCAIRWPSLWTIAKSLVTGFTVALVPRNKQVSLLNESTSDPVTPLYCLPVDMISGKRTLSHVEIIVGPAHGAGMLLAGIRTIHARHPTRPKHEFLTQVLASGSVREP